MCIIWLVSLIYHFKIQMSVVKRWWLKRPSTYSATLQPLIRVPAVMKYLGKSWKFKIFFPRLEKVMENRKVPKRSWKSHGKWFFRILPILWFPQKKKSNWNVLFTISNTIIIVVHLKNQKSVYDFVKNVMDFEFVIEKSWKSNGIYISRRCRNPD